MITAQSIEQHFSLPAGSVCLTVQEGRPSCVPPLTSEQQAELEWAWPRGTFTRSALDILARDGVEVEPGVVLGATEADVQQWSRLQVHLDGKHEKASKVSGLTWEDVRPSFDAAPIEVKRKGGAPWVTTVGAVRSAITVVGDAYLAAWAASES